jgi:hypothetical protein
MGWISRKQYMITLKKDFVNEATKSYCKNRKLSSGKAYFLQKDNGDIAYGGKKCAQDKTTTDLSTIPDFTTSLMHRKNGKIGVKKKSVGSNSIKDNNNLGSKAVLYLILRKEKLIHFNYISKSYDYKELNHYYELYKTNGTLDDKSLEHILNIEKYSSKKTEKKLSLKNLLTCYAYDDTLKKTLKYLKQQNKKNGIKFISSVIDGLHNYCSLSDKQVDAISNWLKYLPKDIKKSKLKPFNVTNNKKFKSTK